jgi:hypothetical protein
MVKPILKKLSHSKTNSLDLDRGWDEQQNQGWQGVYESAGPAKDVGFAAGTGGDGGGSGLRKYGHMRSTSGTSHMSVATNGSSNRAFIHPFQQTPRTSTPPLSYANSVASLDNQRDYSPAITEGEDDADAFSPMSTGPPLPHYHTSGTFSQTNLRRPSLASQRTSSLSDIHSALPQLRVTTGRSTPATSRLAHGSVAASQSDIEVNLPGSNHESPIGSLNGTSAEGSTTNIPAQALMSPTSSVAAMSPLRSSLDTASFPRLRSRSEVDAAARAEHIREARRKFEERERVKDEKYDREQIRKRERRDTREASRIERDAAHRRKGSFAGSAAGAAAAGAASTGGDGRRPSTSRKTTPTNLPASVPAAKLLGGVSATAASSRLDLTSPRSGASSGSASRKNSIGGAMCKTSAPAMDSSAEKQVAFMSSNYESVPASQMPPRFGPSVDDIRFDHQQRARRASTKRKTQSYWHGFILWFRTKLLRLGAS